MIKTRGFTITELAIVLGVAGVIVGAVWSAAATVSNNNKAYLTVQQVGQIAQNIREYYMNAQGVPVAACTTDITAAVDANDLFPEGMRTACSGCVGDTYEINSPYVNAAGPAGGIGGGSVRVMGSGTCSGTPPTAPPYYESRFQIVLTNLSPAACAKMLFSGVGYQDESMGITQVCAGSETGAAKPCYTHPPTASWLSIACNSGICGVCSVANLLPNGSCNVLPTPITQAQAQTYCASASTSEVAWEFSVRH